MSGWFEFFVALAVFLASHVIPVRPPVRPWLVARLGLRGYYTGYSMVSILILIWLIAAAERAPYVGVVPPWDLLRWAPLLVMPVVCYLAVAGMRGRNPLSFGGIGAKPFDPARPGLLAASRHPLLLAMALWAFAHLLANGDLAHVVLFGLFGGFAVLGMNVIDSRKKRQFGAAEWTRLSRNTHRFSLAHLTWDRGLALWSALIFLGLLGLHVPIIGYSPLPW